MIDYRLVPAFCINLDSRPDRWVAVQEQFRKLGWPVTRFSAVRYESKSPNRLSVNHAGAMDSHKKVWGMISELKCEVAAVFEDDAMFPSDFADVFPKAYGELPEDWQVWHLHSFGPQQTRNIVPNGTLTTRLMRTGWGAHGYLLKKKFASKLIDFCDSKKMNDDVLLTSGLLSHGVQPYGTMLKHTLCFQSGIDSNIPETAQVRYWKAVMNTYNR